MPILQPQRVKKDLIHMFKTAKTQKIQAFQRHFQSYGKFSISVDVWTSSTMTAFLGITVHYMDQDFNITNCLLSITALNEAYTGEYLARILVEQLRSFQIEKHVIR
jgi:hypothetical protein